MQSLHCAASDSLLPEALCRHCEGTASIRNGDAASLFNGDMPEEAGKVPERLAVIANDVKRRRSPSLAPRNDAPQ